MLPSGRRCLTKWLPGSQHLAWLNGRPRALGRDRRRPVHDHAEPRGRIETALNYGTNLHDARRATLADPRLKLHNNDSERELRSLKKGLDNWMHFETKAGLEVYNVYRSLIASCALHRLNHIDYLEEVLRPAPTKPGQMPRTALNLMHHERPWRTGQSRGR
ncbi:MAG: transposase [Deltaproteobacteria bacterium]|nr:transposase [Deltaproteobacteria bacterium]